MNHDLEEPVVYRCATCDTVFEEGVADPGPDGQPRCPQCGLWDVALVDGEVPPFVVRRTTRFR